MIVVIGMGTGSAPPRIEDADLVVGARRHLAAAELPPTAEQLPLGPLGPALDRIAERLAAAADGQGDRAAPAPENPAVSVTERQRGDAGASPDAADSPPEPGPVPGAGTRPPERGASARPRRGVGDAAPEAQAEAGPGNSLPAQPAQPGPGAQPRPGSGAEPRGGLGGAAPEFREGAGSGNNPPRTPRVVVLASGDPGFFGVVRALAERFGPHALDVRPAAPSVAVAFARVGLPWDDATVVSAHGRDLRTAVNVCRAHPKTAVLTGPGAGPAELGTALARAGAACTLVVASGVGTADEDVVRLSPAAAAERRWDGAVSVVLCLDERRLLSPPRTLAGAAAPTATAAAPPHWALPEEEFDHRAGMVTKYEVRALALARLAPRLGDLVWDVGAGSGSVAVECARLGAAAIAVEKSADDAERIRTNAAAHGVDVQTVHGTAPAALSGLPDPDAVFVGGGGDNLPEVVAACAARARRAVVVTLAAVDRVPAVRAALAAAGLAPDGVLLQSSRLAPLPGEVTRLAATNPVFVLWGLRGGPAGGGGEGGQDRPDAAAGSAPTAAPGRPATRARGDGDGAGGALPLAPDRTSPPTTEYFSPPTPRVSGHASPTSSTSGYAPPPPSPGRDRPAADPPTRTTRSPTVIGLISATRAGAAARDRLAAAWPGRCRVYEGPVREAVERAFGECGQLVCFLATGATVRLVAPRLRDKAHDPGVVCVDEGLQWAVALTGGHDGGANALAQEVAEAFSGCRPVVTTASDAVGIPGLDQLGWPVAGSVAAVARAVLDGEGVALRADAEWPLPALPGNVVRDGDCRHRILVTDKAADWDSSTVALHPPSLVVGVGASRGVPADEVLELIGAALADAGLTPLSVAALATVEAKADEPGLRAAAERLGVPLRTYAAEELAAVDVPNPSGAPLAAVGTPSVAEAAALLAAGPGGELVVPKRKSTPAVPADRAGLAGPVSAASTPAALADSSSSAGLDPAASAPAASPGPAAASRDTAGRPAMATCAVARRRPRGRLAVVGLGPGARDLLTPRARAELRRASVVVGLDQYVEQIRDLLRPGTRMLASGLGAEEERARTAVAEARAGRAVALVGSGDAGVYAMASPALAEAADEEGAAGTAGAFDVVGVPGVTAALAAAALLGAPLGHDHVSISLSDLHTPWEVIEHRVRAAAEADLVVTFYNPRSRARDWQLPKALGLLAEHRAPATPVGVVRSATRADESVRLTTLAELDPAGVDMMTVVTVGNTATREIAGRMVTPRGYRWQR